jgi:hypothetical protein
VWVINIWKIKQKFAIVKKVAKCLVVKVEEDLNGWLYNQGKAKIRKRNRALLNEKIWL